MIRAVGDSALIVDQHTPRLVSARGVVARWAGVRDHATLADPPRLAIMRRDGGVEVIDVDTGQVQRLFERRIVPLAFSPDGASLFALDVHDRDPSEVVVVVVDERGKTRSLGRWFNRAVTSKRGHVAGVRREGGVVLVDVDGHEVSVGDGNQSRPIAFSADAARVALLRGDGRIEQCDTRRGLVMRDRPPFSAAHVVAAWLSADLDDVAVLERGGTVRRGRRSGEAREHRGMQTRSRGHTIGDVRVDGAHGSSVIDAARSIDACFTPRGSCVGIRDARAWVFDFDDARAVEGPTNLVLITPHPRGVLAVDDEDRAHVLAIDDEVSS